MKEILTVAATPETETAPTARLDCLSAFLIIVGMLQNEKGKKNWNQLCNGLQTMRVEARSWSEGCRCAVEERWKRR